MDLGKLYGRGIAFPPRVGQDGRVAWSEGPQNVRESIRIILLTQMGERLMLPEFGGGLRSFLYEPNTPTTRRLIQERITQSLTRWEPRIQLESVTVEQDPEDQQVAVATIRYKLVSTREDDRLSVSVRLTGQGER